MALMILSSVVSSVRRREIVDFENNLSSSYIVGLYQQIYILTSH